MPIDPRLLGSPGLPPEADLLRRVAELEARCAKLERSGAAGWTYAEDLGSEVLSSGAPNGANRCSRQLVVPAATKALRVLGVAELNGAGATTGVVSGWVRAQNDAGAWVDAIKGWDTLTPPLVTINYVTKLAGLATTDGWGQEIVFLTASGSILSGARQWAVQFRHHGGGTTNVTVGKVRLWLGFV